MATSTDIQEELNALCDHFGVADLYVFGSRGQEVAARVRGGGPGAQLEPGPEAGHPPVSPYSDADFGVRPLPGHRLSVDHLPALAGALEDLFQVQRADLVLLPTAPPFLALEVIRGELLYCADPDAQAEHELYVLRRAGDLAPFQVKRHALALSRWNDA